MAQRFDPATATDDELMLLSQANDTGAFEQLYDRYGALAYRVARAVCHDQHRAEDAVQDGFLSIWRARSSYLASSGTFKSWAMRIVRNRAIDLNRRETSAHRRALAGAGQAAELPPSGSPEDHAIVRTDVDTLRASLEQLPDAQAEVITLAFYGELTHAEIARHLSLPKGTVKGRMRLGLDRLRRQIPARG